MANLFHAVPSRLTSLLASDAEPRRSSWRNVNSADSAVHLNRARKQPIALSYRIHRISRLTATCVNDPEIPTSRCSLDEV